VDGREAGTVDGKIGGEESGGRNVFADDDFGEAELLGIEFSEQVEFVGAHDGVGGELTDDESVGVDEAHWAVADAEKSFAGGGDAAGRHFEHFKGSFAAGGKTRRSAEKGDAAEVGGGDGGKAVEIIQDELLADSAEGGAEAFVFCGAMEESEEAGGKDEVGEAAGHDEAFVIGLGREADNKEIAAGLIGLSELAFFVAGDNQVAVGETRFQKDADGGSAFGTIAGASERDKKAGDAIGKSIRALKKQSACANGLDVDGKIALQGKAEAVAGVFGTARAGEDDGLGAVKQAQELIA